MSWRKGHRDRAEKVLECAERLYPGDKEPLTEAIAGALEELELRLYREYALNCYQQGKVAGEALAHYQRAAMEAERELVESAIPIRFDNGVRYFVASFAGGAADQAEPEGHPPPRGLTLAVERDDNEDGGPVFYQYRLDESAPCGTALMEMEERRSRWE